MALSISNWVTIGVAVLTLAVHGGYIVWRQPDVRYGTGGAYIHPTLGIATVGVKNWGGADAENVSFTISLPDPFTEISTDKLATRFELSAESSDKKSVTGTINRLVAGEIVNIYFSTEPASPWGDKRPVIQDGKFNGGLARPGVPIMRGWGPGALLFSAVWATILGFAARSERRSRESYRNHLLEAIQMGHAAARSGESEEPLHTRVEAYYQRLSWFQSRPRKETLIACAQTAFTLAREEVSSSRARVRSLILGRIWRLNGAEGGEHGGFDIQGSVPVGGWGGGRDCDRAGLTRPGDRQAVASDPGAREARTVG